MKTQTKKIRHAARAHARLGASDSRRWILCPGCIAFQEKCFADNPALIPTGDREAANEGEFAHEVAEWCHHNKHSAISAETKQHFSDTEYDLESICQQVQNYYDYIKSQTRVCSECQVFCELQVDYSAWVQDGFGTIDFAIFEGECCKIFDLKYGRIPVRVEEYSTPARINSQLGLYALGMLQHLRDLEGEREPLSFQLHIVQPRIDNYDKIEISKKKLLKFADYVSERAQIVLRGETKLIPGKEQCQWCDVRNVCPAVRQESI